MSRSKKHPEQAPKVLITDETKRVVKLAELFKALGIVNNETDFCNRINYTPQNMTAVKRGVRNIPDHKVIQTEIVFGINPDFIRNGRIPVFKSGSKYEEYNQIISTNLLLERFDLVKNKKFAEISSFDRLGYTEVPYISIAARASFDYDVFSDCEKETEVYKVHNFKPENGKRYFVVEINGDSMGDQLKNRTKVLSYLIDKSDWQYITGVVAISYKNAFEVKRIIDNELFEKGHLTLHSDNTKAGSKVVPVDDIRAILKVFKIIDAPVE